MKKLIISFFILIEIALFWLLGNSSYSASYNEARVEYLLNKTTTYTQADYTEMISQYEAIQQILEDPDEDLSESYLADLVYTNCQLQDILDSAYVGGHMNRQTLRIYTERLMENGGEDEAIDY